MSWILLVGAVLNLAGAIKLLAVERAAGDGDSVLFRWFTLGAATTFGALYLYLYWHTEYVYPFLIGAALKTWAFTIAAVLYLRKRLSSRRLVEFDVTNLVVAIGFWVYLATA